MKIRTRRGLSQGLAAVLLLAGVGVGTAGPAGAATAPDYGTLSISYTGAANPPTADKPESKLWWNDGSWWADMWTSGSGWHIYKLDRASKKWVDTGVPIDTRANTLADTLWDGTHLYIASHVVTASSETVTEPSLPNQPAKLYRYSYANGTYKLDSGFPATIATKSSESMTIDKDSTGVVWATWTEVNATATGSYTSSVMVNNSGPDGASWGTPFVLPVNNVHPAVDDISAVVAFNKKQIGVMWSDQTTGSVWWATRTDGTAATSWKSQPAVQGKGIADDHLNLKSLQADTAGRVYAAVKTSLDETTTDMTQPQLQLLVFKPGTGAFSKSTISTLADCQTRPQIVLDPDNNKIHAFQTGPSTNVSGCPYAGVSGSIYEKTADMDNPVFGSGRGTPIIQNGSSATVNNPTTTKQPVTSTSGIVVLASDDAAKRYWFADLAVKSSLPYPVQGPIGDKYAEVSDLVGLPIANEVTNQRFGGSYQKFEHGIIAYLPGSGAFAVVNGINTTWTGSGAQDGDLGYPTSDEYSPMAGGVMQDFQFGKISWNAATGSRITKGGIGATWDNAGGPLSGLGYPTTDEYAPIPGGVMQGFQYGKISWNAATGSHITKGGIGATWDNAGGPASGLGYPTTDEYATANGGVTQAFQYGQIVWSPATGSHIIKGGIGQTWINAGGPNSGLGYPTSDEIGGLVSGGAKQYFQGGEVVWSPTTGARIVTGGIRSTWVSLGSERGRLGYPTTGEYSAGGGAYAQDFQGGRITWRSGSVSVAYA